jgi:mycoredoxin-dependent peroxiredoxin
MTLRVGEPAPDFTLRDQHGRRRSLSGMRGARSVLLVFFPFAFTGVCTGELRELRDQVRRVEEYDGELLAISCDPMFSLRVFADQDGLVYPLLSDFWPHGEVARAYGAFDEERGCPTRSSFVVDREGVLRWSVHSAMGEARSVDDYLAALDRTRGTSSGER